MTLSEVRVCAGIYTKYSNNSLYGAWLNLSNYPGKEEFYEACRELHEDEEDAEYTLQDWENVSESLVGESWISKNFFALCNAVEDLNGTEQEAFSMWCNYKDHDLSGEDVNDLVRVFQDEYIEQCDDEEDFVMQIVAECYELLDFVKTCFDYRRFARDLFMCDHWFDDDFVFCVA